LFAILCFYTGVCNYNVLLVAQRNEEVIQKETKSCSGIAVCGIPYPINNSVSIKPYWQLKDEVKSIKQGAL